MCFARPSGTSLPWVLNVRITLRVSQFRTCLLMIYITAYDEVDLHPRRRGKAPHICHGPDHISQGPIEGLLLFFFLARGPLSIMNNMMVFWGPTMSTAIVDLTLGLNLFSTAGESIIGFVCGQPPRIQSSLNLLCWALFSLSHHFLVWLAAEQVYPNQGPFTRSTVGLWTFFGLSKPSLTNTKNDVGNSRNYLSF